MFITIPITPKVQNMLSALFPAGYPPIFFMPVAQWPGMPGSAGSYPLAGNYGLYLTLGFGSDTSTSTQSLSPAPTPILPTVSLPCTGMPLANPMAPVPSSSLQNIPDIVMWFQSLDHHPERNHDGISFAQFGPILRGKHFI